MKAHVLQQSMIAIVFAIIIPYTLWWGVQIVAPVPSYQAFYKKFQEAYKNELKILDKKSDELDKKITSSYMSKKAEDNNRNKEKVVWQERGKLWKSSKMYKEYHEKMKEHEEVLFWSSSVLGLGALIFGSVMVLPIVGSGIMVAGGVLVVLSHFFEILKLLHVIVMTIALLAMIGLAYRSTMQQEE